MKASNQCIWNVASESIRREYGFSNRVHHGYNGSFDKNCLGSLFTIQHMQFSHYINANVRNIYCMNFKRDRNLICTGTYDQWIHIFDWKNDKLKYMFKTKHGDRICDVKFLNTGGDGMDIVSACSNGHILHSCIAPAGNFLSKSIFSTYTYQQHRLVTIPRKPLEFIAGSWSGEVFQIDLRCENLSLRPDVIISGENGRDFGIEEIAHHPFAPEICVSGTDAFVRTFDKRNLKEVMHKMYPSTLNNKPGHISYCAYNYDGSEILANYLDQGAFLFDNKCYSPGEFIHSYDKSFGTSSTDKANFFGPKSEYIVRGANKRKIFFQDKNTEAIVECKFENADPRKFYHILETHPQLPIVATSSAYGVILIWAPTRFKINSTECDSDDDDDDDYDNNDFDDNDDDNDDE